MKRGLCLSLLGTMAVAATSIAQPPLSVHISSPATGASVEHRQEVSGTVSDPDAEVWLVVRPKDTSEFWVQPPITTKEDGSWSVVPYFGRSPSQDARKVFELRAFANPTTPLKEGKAANWPTAQGKSNVVEVVRR